MADTFKIPFSPGIIGAQLLKEAPAAMFPCTIGNAATYWYGGAQAIYQGARRLGLQEGDLVLVPAYSCGSEVAPLLAAGLSVEYYRSLPDLSPDFSHLDFLCRKKNPKSLFFIHYFGFPQPLKALADFKQKHDLFLIEDNAHGLYSMDGAGDPLGLLGDIAIFSFTKSLPTPDGGALVINHENRIEPPENGIPPQFSSIGKKVAGKTAYQLNRIITKMNARAGNAFQAQLIDRFSVKRHMDDHEESSWDTADMTDNYLDFDLLRANWRMSSVSRFLIERQSHSSIRHTRRRNFSLLLESCKNADEDIVPLFSSLPKGVCPLLFPVLARESLSLYRFLRSWGVEVLRFWRFFHSDHPRDQFTFETALKKNVIALPIHQDVSETEVLYMADLLREWPAAKGRNFHFGNKNECTA
jgi:dTDP-4-amino-4,6-dideoxygalactose transaminase